MRRGWKPLPESVIRPRIEWVMEHDRCFACGSRMGVAVHEVIAGRDGTKLIDPAGWVALCPACHSAYQVTSQAMIVRALRLKRKCDPENYDVGRVVRQWRPKCNESLVEEITREVEA